MKKIYLIISILISLSFVHHLSAQVKEKRMLEAFDKISAGSEINVELILDKEEYLELEFENAEANNLTTEISEGTLKLRMKTGQYKDAVLKVRLYYKDIRFIESTARANVWSEETLYLTDLGLKINNGGEVHLNLVCDSLDAWISQGGMLYLKGETRAQQVKVGTGATFSGYEFESKISHISTNSGGKAKVSVSVYLNANASSKGWIGYVGEPAKVDKKTSLGGEILETVLDE